MSLGDDVLEIFGEGVSDEGVRWQLPAGERVIGAEPFVWMSKASDRWFDESQWTLSEDPDAAS